MQAFLELISLLVLMAAGMTLLIGSLNALFGWDLALKIGGSTIPLPEEFVGVIAVVVGLLVCSGLCFLLADIKRPLGFLRRHYRSALISLVVVTALIVIGLPRIMPDFFLELAVQGGQSAKAQAMLEKRTYPVSVLNDLSYWSLKNEDYPLTHKLLDQGADINHRRGEFTGTLLHDAVIFFPPAATDFLLDKGIKINAKDSLGRTAMHLLLTYRTNHQADLKEAELLGMVKKLVAAGADKTLTDQNGDTPLALAEKNRYETIVDFLRQP